MKTRNLWFALMLGLVALAPLTSRADDDDDEEEEHEGQHARGRTDGARGDPAWKTYAAECGSCHLAYPPRFLPAASWQRQLATLNDHFGQNAELDEATRKELSAFLTRWAGPPRGQAPLRITEMAFWRHEHDEISAPVFKRKAVGSPANCPACHVNAEQGDFDEHGVKIPKDANPPR